MEYDNFRAAIQSALGCAPDEIRNDGKIHRFATNGKRHDTAGWYVFFDGNPSGGAFGCYRAGLTETWCSKKPSELTSEERDAHRARVEQARADAAKQQAEAHAQAAKQAQTIWDAATPCTEHQYLTDKRVQSYGLRVGRWTRVDLETGDIWLDVPDALLVPMRSGKKITSLQAIFPAPINGRNKDFLSGGKKRGSYFPIGKPIKRGNMTTIYIAEGYSTAATIHEATGDAVIIAFDAGNLPAVAEKIRAAFPSDNLVIVADNDRFPNDQGIIHGTGIKKAHEAAKLAQAHVIIPEFQPEHDDQRPTDINDLAALYGLDEVRRQLAAGVPATVATTEPAERLPTTIDTVTPLIHTAARGKPLATIENLQEILRRLNVHIRYDIIKKDEEILIPRHSFTLDNAANASIAYILSWCGQFNFPTGLVGDFITYIADQNLYNPVTTWIESNPWDGVSRWQAFMDTVTSTDENLKYILMHRWMISAVAAAFEPNGISAHGVLVFLGDQYVGKTKWFKSLVPESLGVIQDGIRLDPKDKDSVKQCTSNWLVELGEIDSTFKKSDIAELKAFLTRKSDTFRRAYARRESHYARKTVFFGSVNPRIYLNDPTGNRRFWTIEVTKLNHSHDLDMQQVWAEFLHIWRSGEGYYLTAAELDMLNQSNLEYTATDAVDERLGSFLDWDAPELQWTWMTATDALLMVGIDRPTKSDVTKAAILIRQKNGDQSKRTGQARYLLCPPKKD